MSVGRVWIVCATVLAGAAGCRGTAPPLPPIPAGSGQVMVRAGEAPAIREGQVLVDRVVAVVNGEVVMLSELQEAVLIFQRESQAPAAGDRDRPELERQVLERMVNHRLQVQEAQREKIEVAEEDVRGVLDDFVRRNGGDREKIDAQLRGQGLSWDAIRRDFRDQLLAQRVRARRVGRRASVTEAEVDAYLSDNRAKFEAALKFRARHLVVLAEPPDQPAAWERARAEVDALAARARQGADLADLVRERSKDAAAGDLGWLARGELEAAFEGPILALSPGGVTEPIKAGSGYHLFRLEERETLTVQMLADARQQARELLVQKKAQERFDEWVEGLRRRALIAIRL